MKKITLLILICVLISASSAVRAETILKFDLKSGTLSVTVNSQANMDKNFVSFAVVPCGIDENDIEIIDNSVKNVFYKTAMTDSDGNLTLEFSLPQGFESGQYRIFSYDSDGSGSINRFGFADSSITQDLSAVNAAGDASEMKNAVERLEAYRIDEGVFSSCGDIIAQYLYSARPAGGYCTEDFIKEYGVSEGIARFRTGEIALTDFLTEYSAYLDIDYRNTYGPLSQEAKNEADKLFKSLSAEVEGNAEEVLLNILDIAEIRGCETKTELRNAYIRSATERNRSLDNYYSLSSYDKDSLFLTMLSRLANTGSLSEIDKIFDELILRLKTGGQSPGGGSKGGGGSSNLRSTGINTYISASPEEAEKAFTDTAGHWAEEYIDALSEGGIINGFEDGSFRPDNRVTRAEFIKMVCLMFNINSAEGCSFSDVLPTAWYYPALCSAYNNGLVSGYEDNCFKPDLPISREDAAVIIQRVLNFDTQFELAFADLDEISDYSTDAVRALANKNILTGYADNTFNPHGSITRAEAAALVMRAAQSIDAN